MSQVPFLLEVLIVLHFLGLAALIGGFLVQIKSTPRIINGAILYGAIAQLITGLLIVGILYPLQASDPDNYSTAPDAKIGVKLLILIGILILAVINRKKPAITTAVWALIGGLAIVNVVIAVFWH